ncbi:MAG: hypothetical protein LBD16_07280 [Oscillospiraceae bacterium]|jgi:hypothetical protein|nr:hypothetical protein [Oscillospiraceae bacterium]
MSSGCGSATTNYSDYYSTFFGNHYATKGYGATNGNTCAGPNVAYQGYPVAPDNCCNGGFSAGVGEYDSRCFFAIPNVCPVTRSAELDVSDLRLTQSEEEIVALRERRRARRKSGETSLDSLYKEVFGMDPQETAAQEADAPAYDTYPVAGGGEYDCLGEESQETRDARRRRAYQKRQQG